MYLHQWYSWKSSWAFRECRSNPYNVSPRSNLYRGLTNRRMIVCSSRCKMAFPITIEDYYLVGVFIGYKSDNDIFFRIRIAILERFVVLLYLFIILHDVDLHLPGF